MYVWSPRVTLSGEVVAAAMAIGLALASQSDIVLAVAVAVLCRPQWTCTLQYATPVAGLSDAGGC